MSEYILVEPRWRASAMLFKRIFGFAEVTEQGRLT